MKAIRRTIYYLMVIILILSWWAPATPVSAQTPAFQMWIHSINSDAFPAVEVNTSVSDAQGKPVQGLSAADFQISEDGKAIDKFDLNGFQNTSQPLAVALVLDTSGSMGSYTPSALQNAVEAASGFIAALQPQDSVALVTFADSAEVKQSSTTDRAALKTVLASLAPKGETTLYDGIIEAVAQLKNRSERRIIVLLTDGADTSSKFSLDEAIDEASRWSIPIYPIGFGSVDQIELDKIARLSGGSAQISPDSKELKNAFTNVLKILRQQYKIAFHSNLQADGKEHELMVRVNYQGTSLEQKVQFVARPGQVTFTMPDINADQPVGGKIRIAPVVTAPAKTALVEVLLDGAPLDKAMTEPFEIIWDSTKILPGAHTLTVKVTDAAGNSTEKALNLDIKSPIEVVFSELQEGQSVSGKVAIKALVDSLTSVSRVEFTLDDKPLDLQEAGPYPAGEFNYEWDTTQLEPGYHTIGVKASDTGENSAEAKVKVNVEMQSDKGLLWLALIILIVAAVLIIPLSRLSRKRLQTASSGGGVMAPEAPSGARQTGGTGSLVLVEIDGHMPGSVHPLPAGETSLGRKRDENDIYLKGVRASRNQAMIRIQADSCVLFNLSPDNPILVNGNPIPQQRVLEEGDEIAAGESIFRLERR